MTNEPPGSDARFRVPGVHAPKPLLSAEAERQLSDRQVELLDELEHRLTHEGLGDRTMAEIAALTNCSLRTLYGIAPSKDELLLTIVDRRLRRIGRSAMEGLEPDWPAMKALRTYLRAAHEAVQPEAVALSNDLAKVAGADRLISAHGAYVVAVTRSLLDRAVSEGEIEPVDTVAMAHVLGGLGREFARPDLREIVDISAKDSADGVAEVILRGLVRP